jgi:hypothetical protein
MIFKIAFSLFFGFIGTALMIHYEKQLGPFRLLLLIVIIVSYFNAVKLLILNWREDQMLTMRERKTVHFLGYLIIGLGMMAFLISIALRFGFFPSLRS